MKIIIIGGVAAGMTAAAKAIREDKNADITVIEKEDYISFGACGLPYYIGEYFDDINRLYSASIEEMRERGINILSSHEAIDIDFDKKKVLVKSCVEEKEFELEYDRLMIATGGHPFVPKIEGIDAENVFTMTKPYDGKNFKDKLKDYDNIAVIGGGFIGVEIAEQLSERLGKNVRLYHSRDSLLNRVFDKDMAKGIEEELKRVGVEIIYNERLKDVVTEAGKVTEIITENRQDKVDAVILSVGFRPSTDFITDERLKKLKNGAIVVDNFGKTSIEDVFSAGDCATVPHKFLGNVNIPLATSANKMGKLIGINLVNTDGNLRGDYESVGSSVIKVGELEFASAGLTEDMARNLEIDYKVTTAEIYNHTPYMPNANKIKYKMLYKASDKTFIGAQIYGKNEAVLRILPFIVAIQEELSADELNYYDFPYAPPFALAWEGVNTAAGIVAGAK
ncbi:MAG: CoA-disulfide reductase [Tissierellia bacterium]|nr:CoA-disulfide reductase [Tissierellia bacterium]